MEQVDSQDTGLAWVFLIVFAFALIIVHFIIYPSINSKLIPALLAASTDTTGEVEHNIRNVMKILRITSYLFFFSGFVYALLAIFKGERRDYYV